MKNQTMKEEKFSDCQIINDFEEFAEKSDVILANRYEKILEPVKDKVYTRDIYNKDE